MVKNWRRFCLEFFQTKQNILLACLVFAVMGIYMLVIPFLHGPRIFETFYRAAEHLWTGENPYGAYPGFNYYKYSLTFLLFPLSLHILLPLTLSAFLWQMVSTAVYLCGCIVFFTGLTREKWKSSIFFSLIFPLLLTFDLSANGVYLQSNTLIAGSILLGAGWYRQGKYSRSALILAFFGNVKGLPVILSLLLFLDRKGRYVLQTLTYHLFFILFPFLILGFEKGYSLYSSWWSLLSSEGKPLGSEEIHHYLSIKAFLQVNFDLSLGNLYFVAALVVGMAIGLTVFITRRHLSKGSVSQILCLGLTYILIFNPRSETPSLIFAAPVYATLFLGLWQNQILRRPFRIAIGSLFGMALTMASLSTSDLFKGTPIQRLFWEYNLRTLGLVILFGLVLTSLCSRPLKRQLFG